MNEAAFAGVGGVAEHALPKEGRTNAHAVKPAHQLSILPGLNRVGMAEAVQLGEDINNRLVDPGVSAGSGAAADNTCKIGIHPDFIRVAAQKLAQLARYMKAAIKRQYSAHFRLKPVKLGRICAVRHGENSAGIGFQHQGGGQVHILLAVGAGFAQIYSNKHNREKQMGNQNMFERVMDGRTSVPELRDIYNNYSNSAIRAGATAFAVAGAGLALFVNNVGGALVPVATTLAFAICAGRSAIQAMHARFTHQEILCRGGRVYAGGPQ